MRLVNNSTGTAYVSTGASDGNGMFVHSAPPGRYTTYTGPTATGAWTATGNTDYLVAATAGDDFVAKSITVSASSPYAPATGILPGEEVTAANPYNVKAFGATGSGKTISDGVMNGTTAVLTSVSNPFVAGDVGKTILVYGAGAAGAQLATTVASFQSAGQVTLTAVSATAVGAATVYWGTVDLTAAIALAITAKGTSQATIKIPAGIYMVTANASINLVSNTTLQGEGRQTILVWAGATAQPTIVNNSLQSYNANRNNQVNITVRDLAIVGQASTQLGVAGGVIYFAYVTGATVTGVYINGINAIGILFNKSINGTFVDNEVVGTAGGIWAPESDGWLIANNRIYTPTDDGIAIYGGDGAQGFDVTNGAIIGNVIRDNGGANAGITIDIASVATTESKGVFVVSVVGNTITTSSSHGIIIGGNANDVTVEGNVVKNAAFNGIWVSDRKLGAGGPYSPKGINIHNNVLNSCGNVTQIYAAITVDAYTTAPMVGVSIRGNKIRASRNAAILIHAYGSSQSVAAIIRKCAITDNFIQDTTSGSASGIYVFADGTGCIIENLLINDNTFWDSGVATQTYGIFFNFSGAATAGIIRKITVTDNDFLAGFVTAAINIAAPANGGGTDLTTTVISANAGYNTGNVIVPPSGGIDVSSAAPLYIGPNTATQIEIGPSSVAFLNANGGFVGGATQMLFRNNANNANNLVISDAGVITHRSDLVLATAPRILTTGTVPTVGSGGAGTSALSILANSTNTSGRFQVTLTAVAPGVVAGVVAFGGGALATAPLNVVCSLSAPTAGVASPPIVGADTFTTSGFTVRVYGPTTVTTGTYVINYWVSF